jgi:thiol:disulfide interchange protein DsbD
MITNNLTATLLLILASIAANAVAGGLKSDSDPQWLSNNAENNALNNATTFLAVDDAFSFSLNKDEDTATLVWIIATEHYLYRHAFAVSMDIPKADGSIEQQSLTAETTFSQGIKTTDDYFGPVEIYYYQATAQLPMAHISHLASSSDSINSQPQLSIQYQGCAEAGLCYPVQTRKINLP